MADLAKQVYAGGGGGGGSFISDFKGLFALIRTRKTMVFAYGFMFTVISFTAYIAFSPSQNSSSPWFNNIFSSSSTTVTTTSGDGSQFSSFFSYLFPNSSQPIVVQTNPNITRSLNTTTQHQKQVPPPPLNQTITTPLLEQPQLNQTVHKPLVEQPQLNQTVHKPLLEQPQLNQTVNATGSLSGSSGLKDKESSKNGTLVKGVAEKNRVSNYTSSLLKQSKSNTSSSNHESAVNSTSKDSKLKFDKGNVSISVANTSTTKDDYFMFNNVNISSSMMHCDIFDGNWVKDDSYPLFPAGSCPIIDEQFNCYVNGRPDKDFQKHRWQPKGCNIPRLNGKDMLELLRGKRLVFVGDSLNRNMWESLICILRNSISDKSKVFEASGRREFRTDNSYLFIFKDYNCTVEFFRSPFLVQEWEMPETNGLKKETLRLDLVEKSSSKYKDADYIVFNTGHWWTHEKTSKGKDYYQEGSHVYGDLNVVEAFRKALTTWARWVDANVNPKKSLVLFRGYSASHFHGGQWNSGGQCDDETEPIRNDTYLTKYPPKMRVLEKVLNGMKTPVAYLNITRMTDYRKDAHPSIYRKQNLSEEERKSPLRFQDCSHWCLPGVPDAWNELLYAQLLIKQYQKQQQKPPQPQQQKQKKKP